MANPNPPARIGVVTVSDRASAGVYEDRGGPAIAAFLQKTITSPYELLARVIPDERPLVESTLKELADTQGCCLVVTTGGTGPARRDITPAILSRQVAGLRGSCLIINLPGKPSAIEECLLAVFAAVPYCIDLMDGPRIETNPAIVNAFRPKKA